jgi:ubiquinone/menaquinone biosynthesis C-methylase UbiE
MSEEVQVKKDHYDLFNYNSKERFASFWHQINETVLLSPTSVLEVGVGNNIVNNILKNHFNLDVETLDLDPDLNPNFIGSVADMPIESNSFDCVICCQVLEHLPFDKFDTALKELKRVSKKHIVLSLPDKSRSISIKIDKKRMPFVKKIELQFSLPSLRGFKHEFLGEHYWEIGARNYLLKKVNKAIIESGFKIIKTYRVLEMPSHRFFILEK